MLKIKNITFEILREKIIKDFNMSVKPGEVKALFGPSGCGKTTLLRLISGLERPKSGEILNSFKKCAYLFQENRLLDNLNAMENIKLCMQDPNSHEIFDLGGILGLDKRDFNKYPKELSGGMAKRIAFMRAFLSKADLLLLDEPFVGLDRDLKEILAKLIIQRIKQKDMACVLVTHDRYEAVRLSHEILFLSPRLMNVEKILKLQTNLFERDRIYEERVINENFAGKIYYE